MEIIGTHSGTHQNIPACFCSYLHASCSWIILQPVQSSTSPATAAAAAAASPTSDAGGVGAGKGTTSPCRCETAIVRRATAVCGRGNGRRISWVDDDAEDHGMDEALLVKARSPMQETKCHGQQEKRHSRRLGASYTSCPPPEMNDLHDLPLVTLHTSHQEMITSRRPRLWCISVCSLPSSACLGERETCMWCAFRCTPQST